MTLITANACEGPLCGRPPGVYTHVPLTTPLSWVLMFPHSMTGKLMLREV